MQLLTWILGCFLFEQGLGLIAKSRLHSDISAAPEEAAPGPSSLHIGIFSGVTEKYARRRVAWRQSGCGQIYAKANLTWNFVIGVPIETHHDITEHTKGTQATIAEQSMATELLKESETHHDILFVPFRDVYEDLSNKMLGLLFHGYETQADYVMKHDDEFCADTFAILETIADYEKNRRQEELWAGEWLFKGDEYPEMLGPQHIVAPYFSGHGHFMSRGLVGSILGPDYAHDVLSAPYGGQDDSNLGKWVQFAESHHNISVRFVTKTMLRKLANSSE